jgi:hypothetical protein
LGRVLSIDTAGAFCGHVAGLAAHLDREASIHALAQGIPVRSVRDGAMAAADRATELTDANLYSMALAACGASTPPANADSLCEFLERRCRNALRLVEAHLERIEART